MTCSDSKYDAIIKGFESHIKGNGEGFNSYLGINYLAHIDQILIKIIYINRSQFLKIHKLELKLYSERYSHSLLLSTYLTLKCHIQDAHRIQKPSIRSTTWKISSCGPHVHNKRLGPPANLYASTTCLPHSYLHPHLQILLAFYDSSTRYFQRLMTCQG